MKSFFLNLLLLLFGFNYVQAQNITGVELLEKSIDYHDPNHKWSSFKGTLHLTETRPNGADRQSSLKLNNAKNYFYLDQNREGYRVEKSIKNGQCTYQVNGSRAISEDLIKKFRLNCSQIERTRNYYVYLWGMPMKLKDPGTHIQKKVERVNFNQQEVLAMKVTYDKEVGEDIWYFYFNPKNYALVGYRFYHDEAVNDGEYIPLEGEVLLKGIRFPKTRTCTLIKMTVC